MYKIQRLSAAAAVFLFVCTGLGAQETAEDIINVSRSKAALRSIGTRAKLEIQKDGTTITELLIDQYTAKDSKGGQRTFLEIKAPAAFKGTRFLMINQNNSVDQRIYLPSLGKVRRIAGSTEGTNSFMGSDFSYNDIAYLDRPAGLDTYRMETEETYNGVPCYVIEAIPKDSSFEYAKTRIWVDKQNKNFLKTELYDRKNVLVKIIEIGSYQRIQDINTPMVTKMTTIAAGTSTTIRIVKMQYNMNIPEKIFTARYLEQGR